MKKVLTVIIGIVAGIYLLGILSALFTTKSMASSIDDNAKFNYQTSLTSNYDRSDKAKVYISDMSVEETALYLIEEDIPLEHSDLQNNESIMLTYDDYYILIYKGENDETYVQISSRKYVHNNGYVSLYRPYRPSIIGYYDAFYIGSRYYRSNINRYGDSYTRPASRTVVNTKTSNEAKNTTKQSTADSTSTKIKTDKNASTKIKTSASKDNNSSSTNTKKDSTTTSSSSNSKSASNSSSSTNTTSTSNSSSSSKSVRTSSSSARTSTGGGTSPGK